MPPKKKKTTDAKTSGKGKSTKSSSGRKRRLSDSEGEGPPPKKSAVDHLTDAQKQAIFKEVSQQERARKKAEQDAVTQGVFFLSKKRATLFTRFRHTLSQSTAVAK